MAYYRLKENHPDLVKIRKLEEYASELGIEISATRDNQIMLDVEGRKYFYMDVEQTVTGYDVTSSFPYFAETKIVFSDED